MEEQEDYFKNHVAKDNIQDSIEVTEYPSYIPTVIELTDSQLELFKTTGNCYYTSSETYYSLPFWFKHIEGNKFEIILITKNTEEK